ncbi:DNA adenine methylase [Rhizobium leguminosarum]|uniref:DNA adenine methylase n=1 Tax=Rhizobium leguminosarum TaxID=384 RepID=UPI00161A48D2|nr:DNA adenine methylase [Rhizobium leguminosarum]MBB4465427.1 DNA adenine methylase [Rhizobium leguminosarum]MBB4472089.1 DNA adenine methylase [Rhizobium leguminosarum]
MLASPLRYPGGKAKLFYYFTEVIGLNGLFNRTYCEPYAGGAGLALKLLSAGFVNRIAINDIDESIYAFWKSVLEQPKAFCDLIATTPATIEEWYAQREVWRAKDTSNSLKLGFATFFLNRTNRSGIIEGAGPIGGYHQDGPWKLDVRLNRAQQIQQVMNIATFADRIEVSNDDALTFTQRKFEEQDTFCYLDPPYYVKGSKLYRSFYRHKDHCDIAGLLEAYRSSDWVVSYDDVAAIRTIYSAFSPITYSLSYSAGTKASGKEVIYFSESIDAPNVPGFSLAA